MECHSKWNVTQIEISLGISVELKCVTNLNYNKIGMSLKLECHSNWNVTQIGLSHKLECHSN